MIPCETPCRLLRRKEGLGEKDGEEGKKGQRWERKPNSCSFFFNTLFIHALSVCLSPSLQLWTRSDCPPIGPRVPAVEAHPRATLPDTESDEEHKATKAYSESPGEPPPPPTHTHTQTHTHRARERERKAGEHKCMQRRAGTCTISQTYTVHIWTRKQTDKHKSRWMHLLTGTVTHTHTHTQTGTASKSQQTAHTHRRWFSLAQQPAITSDHVTVLSDRKTTHQIDISTFSVHFRSLFTNVSRWDWRRVHWGHCSEIGTNENNTSGSVKHVSVCFNAIISLKTYLINISLLFLRLLTSNVIIVADVVQAQHSFTLTFW